MGPAPARRDMTGEPVPATPSVSRRRTRGLRALHAERTANSKRRLPPQLPERDSLAAPGSGAWVV